MARSKFFGFVDGGQYEDGSIFNRHVNANAGIELSKIERGYALIQYDGSLAYIQNQPMNQHTLTDLCFPVEDNSPVRWGDLRKWNSLNLSPEFANGIFTNLGGTAIAGVMTTEHDLTQAYNYYKWTSDETIWQHYGIAVNYWFPEVPQILDPLEDPPIFKDQRVVWDSFSFVVKVVGAGQCRMTLYDFVDDPVFETTITDTASDWEVQELSAAALNILNNGDPTPPQWVGRKFRMIFRLSAQNGGQVLLSDVNSNFHYELASV